MESKDPVLNHLRVRMSGLSLPESVTKNGSYKGSAAVLIPITKDLQHPEVVLTKRSSKLRSHASEVAFPGGKRDFTDRDLQHTALRETHEEIGVPPRDVEVLGNLEPKRSAHNLAVTPYVGLVEAGMDYVANPHELDEIFHVPLDFFLEQSPAMESRVNGRVYPVPAWEFEGFYIWGLTAAILVDLLNTVFDKHIPYERLR